MLRHKYTKKRLKNKFNQKKELDDKEVVLKILKEKYRLQKEEKWKDYL